MRCFRRSGRRIAPCLVALALPSAAVAQETFPLQGQPSPPYVERVWRTVDGLPHDIVWTVLQTRDGYLWLGTQSGLARFDGVSFTTFTPDEAPGLSGRMVRSLLEDRDGTLWIGTEGGGLFRYRSGRFDWLGTEPRRLGAVVLADEAPPAATTPRLDDRAYATVLVCPFNARRLREEVARCLSRSRHE